MKTVTDGLNPKVPIQSITTILVAALAYFGVNLDAEVSAALGVVVGFVAGYLAPPAPVKHEAGYGVIELLFALILLVLLIWLVLRLLA